ncbi:MAG: hypothetical protein DI547_13650 [Sphingobium sp.]|jgi:hypothetical protein|nr:MAG: hypothetical protein DI547_13650 [Sphingobium sp.]
MDRQFHFYMHLLTPVGEDHDDLGAMFADIGAAYLDVAAAMPDTAAELLRRGIDPMACAYRICDEHGRRLMDVPFAELVRREGRGDMAVMEPVGYAKRGL